MNITGGNYEVNIFFICVFDTFNSSLQEAYDNASSNENYDKYIILEPNSTYNGGLGIYEGDVYINCQGSTIDLEEETEYGFMQMSFTQELISNGILFCH